MLTNSLNNVPYERLNPKLNLVPDNHIVYSSTHELKIMSAQQLYKSKLLN